MTTRPAARPERLRDGRDIAAVLRGRRQRAGRLLVVHARTRPDDAAGPRIAVVASRRVGPAVARNRAKRVLREAARRVVWRDDVDVVLVARPASASVVMSDVESELRRLAADLEVTAP